MSDKKKDESLEQGLSHSATKKGLTGAAKKEYIGGAITNMRKQGRLPARAGAKKATPKRIHESTLIKMRGKLQVRENQIKLMEGRKLNKEDKQLLEQRKEEARRLRETLNQFSNAPKPESKPKAAAKPKEPEKPKEDKAWSVEAKYKKPNKNKGYRYEDKYGDEEHTGLTEQQAKDMVNSKSNQGKYVSLSVYHNGRTYRSWQRVNREWRLYSTGSYMKL